MRIASYLPVSILNNDELSKLFPEMTPKKVAGKLGVTERHIAADDETAVDMAAKACEKLFAQCDKSSVDFLLLCTQSPDYFLPTSACILQDRLGLSTEIGALDFNLGCSGFIYGLSLAKG